MSACGRIAKGITNGEYILTRIARRGELHDIVEIVLVGQVLHKGTDSKVPCRIFIADTRIDQSVGRLRHDIGIRWQEIHGP